MVAKYESHHNHSTLSPIGELVSTKAFEFGRLSSFLTVLQCPADRYKFILLIVLWIGLLKYLPTMEEEEGGRRVGGCLLKLHKLSHTEGSVGSRQSFRIPIQLKMNF